MPFFNNSDDESIYFSMNDLDNNWSRVAESSFLLDDRSWPSVEHYYQSMKFESDDYREKIRQTKSVQEVIKLGSKRFKKKRPDWAKVKTTVMTRAIYTRFRTHPQFIEGLLATGQEQLIENSQYDYFWGCGRDHRGHNHYGKVLMNVRDKLFAEKEEEKEKAE